MIYGDSPNKINEREDALGLKAYTYTPSISSIMQSGNLYIYCINNPIAFIDADGNSVVGVLAVRFAFGAGTQILSDVLRYIYNDDPNKEFVSSSWQEYLGSAVSNMISFGSSFGGKLLCSFFSNFVCQMITDLGNSNTLDWFSVIVGIVSDMFLIDPLTSISLTDDFINLDSVSFSGKIKIDWSSKKGQILKEILEQFEDTPFASFISTLVGELDFEED